MAADTVSPEIPGTDRLEEPPFSRSALWITWLLGAATLAAVIAMALHLSDVESFMTLFMNAQPLWLIAAVLAQSLTYVAQGQIFRTVLAQGGHALTRWAAIRLSLVKLFVDQALPSSGISGAFAVVAFFIRLGLPRPVVLACLALDLAGYFLAYVASVGVAVLILMVQGHASAPLVAACLAFICVGLILALSGPRLAGNRSLARRVPGQRFALVSKALALLTGADVRLARSRLLLLRVTLLELAIIVLDSATLWLLVLALGVSAPALGLFAGFMVASVVRSVGIMPGGLGAFEGVLVVTLHWAGVDLAVALSATLLFRGLTFWLPMVPGLWMARREWLHDASPTRTQPQADYWSGPIEQLFIDCNSAPSGLSDEQARARRQPSNHPFKQRPQGFMSLALKQLMTPLVLILMTGAIIALVIGDWLDAAIVWCIVALSAVLSAWYENRASTAVEQLRNKVAARATVVRDGKSRDVPASEVVPGDVMLLSAGSLIAADGRIIEATDCFVSESLLTGETFPVEKMPGQSAPDSSLVDRRNCVFMGTSVRSGTARLLVTRHAEDSEMGAIAHALSSRPPETEFERGLRHFGGLLLRIMLVITIVVMGTNILLQRPPLDTLLFAIALSIGMSPELLPAILSITLAKGAQRMAAKGVIVRHLNSIENLGSMDVLCTDKTGTLTRALVVLDRAVDVWGVADAHVLLLATLNATLQTGMRNAIDDAIALAGKDVDVWPGIVKRDEIPYDFVRKRLSIIVGNVPHTGCLMITKGAVETVLQVCTHAQFRGQTCALGAAELASIGERFAQWSEQGYRVLGIASRAMPEQPHYGKQDETGLTFLGFLLFFDPPEPEINDTLTALERLGVQVKIISGDSHLVTRHVAQAVGLPDLQMLTGAQLMQMKDEALMRLAPTTTLFAEVDPNQKERIIRALQKTGHVVGYLGDGINDAPALQTADIGISVDHAADVAKQAADFVLLEHDLNIVREGIEEGRHTFANTLKYLSIVSSANFGNMVSMALASLVLPFLPLLAKQILLNNFLADIPSMSIASDNVDREWERTPHRWNMIDIRNFMVVFGLVSSVFDMATFGVLYLMVGVAPDLFRSGWFVESLLTQLLTIFIVRTYKPFYRSRPARLLLISAVTIAAATVALPYSVVGQWFGLIPLPAQLLLAVLAVSLFYAAAAELTKRVFYHRSDAALTLTSGHTSSSGA
ncbi:magnesium-translocating P-type ATPase [Pseudomonas sp. GD03842]|uniref:magnesium-translocating P-type ATPase n=1 Tax=Pseudomonas sp. GD03842 TaxID=2975385 RepID=UPI002449F652|nr:magnesium-translocating P-type ATPase [Pseudomonas sp. GD03842]MDH0747194.1 magnesium-translocating P-type ATPase [Pseudomonas sp. GD03842]